MSTVPSDPRQVTLRRWRVMEIETRNGARSRHVWGHDVTNNKGRASSAIMEYNTDTMIATTRSGQNYRLLGLPGNSRIGKAAWDNWCSENDIVSESDVTKEYLNIEQLSTLGFEKITNNVNQ